MNNFKLNRFCKMLQWDFVEEFHHLLSYTGGMTIFFGILYSMSRLEVSSSKEGWMTMFLLTIIGSAIGISVLTSTITRSLRKKETGISTLMRPASHLEKFISRIIILVIGGFFCTMLAMAIGDYLRLMIFNLANQDKAAIFPFVMKALTNGANFVKEYGDAFGSSSQRPYTILDSIGIWLSTFAYIGVFVAGGIVFRKFTWGISMILCLILLFIEYVLFPNNGITGNTMTYIVFYSVVTIAIYSLAYWLYKRVQLVDNRWINI